jgi:hypothetical protein
MQTQGASSVGVGFVWSSLWLQRAGSVGVGRGIADKYYGYGEL